jgi:cytochrome P450
VITAAAADVRYDDVGCWVVSGHDAALAAFGHPGLSSRTLHAAYADFIPVADRERFAPLVDVLGRWYVLHDGERHAAARRAMTPVFSPGAIRRFTATLEDLAAEAVGAFLAAGGGDAIPALADVMSARTMAALLGLPECDPARLHAWAAALAGFFATPYRRACARAAQEALAELAAVVERCGPGSLWARVGGERADRLAVCSLMVFGGLETTAGLIGVCLWHMLGNGLAAAVAGPGGAEVAAEIVEQVLAGLPPLGHVARVTAADTALGGCPVPRGELVLLSLTGADPMAPADRPARPPAHRPGRPAHLAFGRGRHYCSGAPLARAEAVALLRRFAAAAPDAEVRRAVWGANRTYRGLDELLIRP